MSMNSRLSRRKFIKLLGTSAAAGAFVSSSDLMRAFAQNVTTISFRGWGGVEEDAAVRAAIEVFQKENPHIRVEWQHIVADFTMVLLTDIAAGTAPDTAFIGSDLYETLRQGGMLLDITDRIRNDPLLGRPGFFFEPQEAARSADAAGRWHGIGSCWVAPHIFYNAALFDQAGITPPGFRDDQIWDWDTFVEIAKQLTVDHHGRHPDDAGFDQENIQCWGVNWPLWWIPIAPAIHTNGGKFITEDGLSGLDSPEALEALQRLADLIYVHHVAPRGAALEALGMPIAAMLDTNRLAMAVDGSWALAWINPTTLTVPMGTGALPKMVRPATFMQAHFHSALAATRHPEEAWQWVRFLATPFYQTQMLKIGLWLPSLTELLTEEGMAGWLTEGIHPDSHAYFVANYLPKYGVTARIPPGWPEALTDHIVPAFEALGLGTPAEEVFPDAVRRANEILRAAQM